MSVEQVVDAYLNAARQILGTTPVPPGGSPPPAAESGPLAQLPTPDWTGNAHQAALEASQALEHARTRLQTAAASVAEITEAAGRISHEAGAELDSITTEWDRDKSAVATLPPGARDAALLTAAQQRIGEVVVLVAATTGRYNEEASKVRQEATGLPNPTDTTTGAAGQPAPPAPAGAPPPPASPPQTQLPAPSTAAPGNPGAEALMPAAAMIPSALGPAMAAPASAMPMASALPAAAAAPLGGLSSMLQSAGQTEPASSSSAGGQQERLTGDFGALGNLTLDSTPREMVSAVLAEAKRRGYSVEQALWCVATMLAESGGNARAVSPNGLWVGPYQQDEGYAGRGNPNTAILEFFNRLDAKGGPSSPDIGKTIFWLQQAPSASSAEAAYANGRQDYLSEIERQLPRATQMYRELTGAGRVVA